MGYMSRGIHLARKAARGTLKFTKKNFKLLGEAYLENCRSSYDAIGQLPVYAEHIRQSDELTDRELRVLHGGRVRGAPGRGRGNIGEASSSRGPGGPARKFRAVEQLEYTEEEEEDEGEYDSEFDCSD